MAYSKDREEGAAPGMRLNFLEFSSVFLANFLLFPMAIFNFQVGGGLHHSNPLSRKMKKNKCASPACHGGEPGEESNIHQVAMENDLDPHRRVAIDKGA